MSTTPPQQENVRKGPPAWGVQGKNVFPAQRGGGAPLQNFSPNQTPVLDTSKNVSPAIKSISKKSAENFLQNPNETPEGKAKLSKYIDRLGINISLPELRMTLEEREPEYDPSFGPLMFEYFNQPKTKKIFETHLYRNGASVQREKMIPSDMPHFTEFARSLRVSEKKLLGWAKKYPEFNRFYQMCKEVQEEFLIHNGLLGNFNANMTTFVATNKTKMKNRMTNEHVTVDINEILNQIEKGVKNNELTDGNIHDI